MLTSDLATAKFWKQDIYILFKVGWQSHAHNPGGATVMNRIDEARLENDLGYRFTYLAEFIQFGTEDIEAIHGAACLLEPLVPALVDAVYVKLFNYDATWRHFVPPQFGYEGDLASDVNSLSLSDDVIKFRKQHLGRYLTALVKKPYDEKMVQYLNTVGAMHTPAAGNPELNVPLVQVNALLGFVSDAIHATIFDLGLDREIEQRTIRAFSKLLWLQNDLINRHYANVPADEEAALAV
jgi:Protoglobin